jgi:hypothetical protein
MSHLRRQEGTDVQGKATVEVNHHIVEIVLSNEITTLGSYHACLSRSVPCLIGFCMRLGRLHVRILWFLSDHERTGKEGIVLCHWQESEDPEL